MIPHKRCVQAKRWLDKNHQKNLRIIANTNKKKEKKS